jgi:hypothetical protein
MATEGMGINRGLGTAGAAEAYAFGGNLELCALHFSNAVAKLCQEMELDSGVARTVRDHLQFYNATVTSDINKALGTKNRAKACRILSEARPNLQKLTHWLAMFENLDDKVAKSARYCRSTGESLGFIIDMTVRSEPQAATPVVLNEGLTDL